MAFTAEVRGLAALSAAAAGAGSFSMTAMPISAMRAAASILRRRPTRGSGAIAAVQRARRASRLRGLGGFDSGWFTRGTADWFTSGPTAGRRSRCGSITRTMARRDLDAVAAGGAADRGGRRRSPSRAGCDKHFATCRGEVRQRGQLPRLPAHAGQRLRVLRYARPAPAMSGHDATPMTTRRVVAAARSLDRHALSSSGERAKASAPTASAWCAASGARLMGAEPEAPPAYTPRLGARPSGGETLLDAARDAHLHATSRLTKLGTGRRASSSACGPASVAKHAAILAPAADAMIHAMEGGCGVLKSRCRHGGGAGIAGVFRFPD